MHKIYPKLVLSIDNKSQLKLLPSSITSTIETCLVMDDASQSNSEPFITEHQLFPLYMNEKQLANSKQQAKGYFINQEIAAKQLKQKIKDLKQHHRDLIIGVHSQNSYDYAMIAGEAETDFIAFEYKQNMDFNKFLYLIETWNDYTVIQSMLLADEIDVEQLKLCLEKGIDFVCFPKTLWDNPNSVVEKIENLNTLLQQYPYTIINFNEE